METATDELLRAITTSRQELSSCDLLRLQRTSDLQHVSTREQVPRK